MGLAETSAKTALNMLTKFGRNITVSRVTSAGTYNGDTGKTSAPSISSAVVKGYLKDYDSRARSSPNLLIQTGDKEFIVSARNFSKPSLADTFTVDGERYTIVPIRESGLEIQTIEVSGLPVLYKIHGRKT